ncbi:MAG: hypothetical protein QG643_530, partial [Pseudomonadota bacterium]|nr:hypothetical protein [Pseudomonadota bacterium]
PRRWVLFGGREHIGTLPETMFHLVAL